MVLRAGRFTRGGPASAAELCLVRGQTRRGRLLQRPDVLRYVNGVSCWQHRQLDDVERSGVSGGQHDGWRRSGSVRLSPPLGEHAPAIAGAEPREPVLGHGGAEVVADASLVLQELSRHHRAHQVRGLVRPGRAAAIPVESRDRVRTARLQRLTEDIRLTAHHASVKRRPNAAQPPARRY